MFSFQVKKCDIIQDPGYEYPPEPELQFRYYKFDENVDDDDDDGDDDDDDRTRDSHNSQKSNSISSNNNNTSNNGRNTNQEGTRNGQTGNSRRDCVAAIKTKQLSTSSANITSKNAKNTSSIRAHSQSHSFVLGNQNDLCDDDDEDDLSCDDTKTDQRPTSWWRYLLPYHYFM